MPESLPSLDELLAGARVVSLPMRVKFRGIMERETLLLRGPAGWGEFCPFPEYGDGEASRWLAAAIEAGWQGFPAPLRSTVPVNATVPAVSAERVPDVLSRFGRVDAVKVKVAERGQTLDDDAARLNAVRAALPSAGIRVDANGGWDVPAALEALTRLAPLGLEYAEQPVPSIEGLAEVRTRLREAGTPVLIAADESVRKESDPLRVARAGAADLVVVKVAPRGGVRRALDIVAQA
ncbi:MAG: o-succinylbenzoate synthase, partial [Pseudarthrobacter sp.]|nr:o-succinylbenzoate synthase [Pseudarthrobacter sp.]